MSLLQVRDLEKVYPLRQGLTRRPIGRIRAVDRVSFSLEPGRCLALVGESGSGKTTLARCTLRLEEPTAGRVLFNGKDLVALGGPELRRFRQQFQMIFQDPFSSLNPRMTVAEIVDEPLTVHERLTLAQRQERVAELLHRVGLPIGLAERLPHALSGGERQRVGIARALAPKPLLLVADEPVSALDAPLRSKILDLLSGLQRQLDLAILLIAHDLSLVERIAEQVAVMYRGRIVESASVIDLYRRPQHPYSRQLLSSVLSGDPRRRRSRIAAWRDPLDAKEVAAGCRFHPRCPIAEDRCRREEPELTAVADGHLVACHFPGEEATASGGGRWHGTFSTGERRNQQRWFDEPPGDQPETGP